jgi:hypothetical protein
MDWEIMHHPPYSPGLDHSDFNFFGPIKVHLRRQKFQTDVSLKHYVLNWLPATVLASVTYQDDRNV